MRRMIVVTALALMMVMTMASAALAGNGYGRAIQDEACFGTTYGQAKNAAWDSDHATKPALGAKLTAIAHGCA